MRTLVVLMVVAAAFMSAAAAPAAPRCFGAAARDPRHPCANPALRLAARPGRIRALITPNEPCTVTGLVGHRPGRVKVCEFGVPRSRASRTIALIGDSHAMAWRAAVTGAVRRLGWHGVNLTRSHCPFNFARRALGRRDARGCGRFNHRVVRWLRHHRGVSAAFVVHQAYGTPYVATGGHRVPRAPSRVHGRWGRTPT